ncbi:hypothetical protein A2164_00385 [Candidatus Curtissbacteria bacterium RBG_13_35_7]|uniref:Uncharacterized protein n=1 Tax=Candidatus Curtissbacteria bacterium RBG_13_35_7 TaxID=1797705 RepID=A0A1F5G0X0_9BACT|nr:MAG: hypothetical protein A2164_00385 [Candidatus Curtissbacteria bacterium RBG_13_35_7]
MTEQDRGISTSETGINSIDSGIKNTRLKSLANFLRVSPVQQACAAINTTSTAFPGYEAAERLANGNYESAVGLIGITLVNLALVVGNEALATHKFLEYKSVKKALAKFGWDSRIIEPKSHSWCQRHAARTGAIDSGYGEEIDQYFAQKGHKWYHFIPRFGN